MDALFLLYVLGVCVGVWRTDGSAPTRLALAAAWPIGVAAAAVTTALLLCAAAVLFPLFGLVLGAGLAAWWLAT